MAYAMIHLEVAYRLLNSYKWINNKGDFMLGALAPDAVHFHKDYTPKLKEKSHLWNCGPKWGITLESDKWEKNILTFWDEHKTDANRDFLAGYCIHILTDRLNDIKIWTPFRNANIEGDNVAEIYHIYGDEAYGSDQWLYQNSPNMGEIVNLISQGKAYDITDCINAEDIERQKRAVLEELYKEKREIAISNYVYCTEEVITSFIKESAEMLSEALR